MTFWILASEEGSTFADWYHRNAATRLPAEPGRKFGGSWGRCKHAGAPDGLCTVFLRGPIPHWNRDRGCEFAQLVDPTGWPRPACAPRFSSPPRGQAGRGRCRRAASLLPPADAAVCLSIEADMKVSRPTRNAP